MSLITDALGLRQRRAGKKIARQEQLPPFRSPKPQRAAVALVGGAMVLGGLAYWRGAEAYDWLERIVLGLPGKPGLASLAPIATVETPVQEQAQAGEKVAEAGGGAAALKTEGPVAPREAVMDPVASAVVQGLPAQARQEPERKDNSAGQLSRKDMESISVSLAPTKEEEEKIRQARELERMREIREYLRRAVIQGVSQDGQDSRVLMDGQLVGQGEKTPLLDLVLEKVEEGQILFRDADGKGYPKSY